LTIRRVGRLAILATGSAIVLAQPVGADVDRATRFPAAGEALQTLVVRARPVASARVVRRLSRFRADHQFRIVLALESQRGANGTRWYLLSLPGRPNGAAAGSRQTTWTSARCRTGVVAIDRTGAETPLGRLVPVLRNSIPPLGAGLLAIARS
jgi:hypothetical protein